MVIFDYKIIIPYAILFLFVENAVSQKLYIPVTDSEIISLYKKGEKSDDGTYISYDKERNIRIKGKFNKLIPIGKWYLFFEDGSLMSNYNYSDEGKINGVFVEYYNTGKIKIVGNFKNNKQVK